jgi:hypothetical protein
VPTCWHLWIPVGIDTSRLAQHIGSEPAGHSEYPTLFGRDASKRARRRKQGKKGDRQRRLVRFGGEKIFARAHGVEPDKPDDPLHIRALSMNGIGVETEPVTDGIEEL